jgi:uncharacterized membrane protein
LQAILWMKVLTATLEVVLGIGLLVLAILDVNVRTWISHFALGELHEDPGDFVARHLMTTVPSLSREREFLFGGLVAAYGVLKGGVVLAVLRHHRRVATAGTVLFTLVALLAAVVLLRDPSPARAVLGALDVAVAVVMWREMLSLHRRTQPARTRPAR